MPQTFSPSKCNGLTKSYDSIDVSGFVEPVLTNLHLGVDSASGLIFTNTNTTLLAIKCNASSTNPVSPRPTACSGFALVYLTL